MKRKKNKMNVRIFKLNFSFINHILRRLSYENEWSKKKKKKKKKKKNFLKQQNCTLFYFLFLELQKSGIDMNK